VTKATRSGGGSLLRPLLYALAGIAIVGGIGLLVAGIEAPTMPQLRFVVLGLAVAAAIVGAVLGQGRFRRGVTPTAEVPWHCPRCGRSVPYMPHTAAVNCRSCAHVFDPNPR
jgi:hypothetical protein